MPQVRSGNHKKLPQWIAKLSSCALFFPHANPLDKNSNFVLPGKSRFLNIAARSWQSLRVSWFSTTRISQEAGRWLKGIDLFCRVSAVHSLICRNKMSIARKGISITKAWNWREFFACMSRNLLSVLLLKSRIAWIFGCCCVLSESQDFFRLQASSPADENEHRFTVSAAYPLFIVNCARSSVLVWSGKSSSGQTPRFSGQGWASPSCRKAEPKLCAD